MNERERLIEILQLFFLCRGDNAAHPVERITALAKFLIGNGVTVQKQGRWIYNTDDFTPAYRCSACGYNNPMIAGERVSQGAMNYCPNCGAKVGKEEEYDRK